MLPAIFGLQGPRLTEREAGFLREVQPLGIILFGRNIESRHQLRALTDTLRDLLERDNLPILIDQEGGKVARLGPPEWPVYPPAYDFSRLYQHDPEAALAAVRFNYEALGLDLAAAGITVDCAPVLDVPQPGAHDIIGNRAFGDHPDVIAKLGAAALEGLEQAGVTGVIKHIPGHGRAEADSHEALPTVTATAAELEIDLAPFQALAGAAMAMTAHVRYTAWDPEHCATLSSRVIRDIIRERIGFDGLLMSDDLDMKALHGSVPELALAALEAGCDVALNCWGKMDDMEGMARVLPEASVACRHRLADAVAHLQPLGEAANIRDRQRRCAAERDRLLSNR